jgi:glutathione synthase/RimK-type ligase-like ATP-grasp enzyme
LRRNEFLQWLKRVSQLTTVRNSLEVVQWNSDKKYLAELSSAGIAVVPTQFVVSASEIHITNPAMDVVVKPSVSAGSHDTSRYHDVSKEMSTITAHISRIVESGATAMVQEYQHGIDGAGETGLVYLNGVYSHAFRKGAILQHRPDMSNGLYAAEDVGEREASDAEQATARQVLSIVEYKFGAMPLYARVDLIPQNNGVPQLMELELVEPSFFLWASAGSADRTAQAIIAANR